jgi:hypothetical protein
MTFAALVAEQFYVFVMDEVTFYRSENTEVYSAITPGTAIPAPDAMIIGIAAKKMMREVSRVFRTFGLGKGRLALA